MMRPGGGGGYGAGDATSYTQQMQQQRNMYGRSGVDGGKCGYIRDCCLVDMCVMR